MKTELLLIYKIKIRKISFQKSNFNITGTGRNIVRLNLLEWTLMILLLLKIFFGFRNYI